MGDSGVADHGGDGASTFRLIRDRNPYAAAGRAMAYLMTDRIFGRMPFGHISRLIAGQVNRGHYLLAVREDAVVGFVGWTLGSKEDGERWLVDAPLDPARTVGEGSICILNFWKAEAPAVSSAFVGALRAMMPDKTHLYAKRHYPDGSVRGVRLPVRLRRRDD